MRFSSFATVTNVLDSIWQMHTVIHLLRAHQYYGFWCFPNERTVHLHIKRRAHTVVCVHVQLCILHHIRIKLPTEYSVIRSLWTYYSDHVRERDHVFRTPFMGHYTFHIVKNSLQYKAVPSIMSYFICRRLRHAPCAVSCTVHQTAYFIQRGENRKLYFVVKPFALVAFTICRFRHVKKNFMRNKPFWHQFYECINVVRARHNTYIRTQKVKYTKKTWTTHCSCRHWCVGKTEKKSL